ncbi:MAG TPA: transcription-repair coupling factor [Candidatus Acidoferrales bacterium]|nr:transcription-repair coupling factor [Candidatus Acidoferrales bacterium]
MILASVDELYSRVVRHPAVDAAIEDLRRGAKESQLDGLTDPARTIVAAQVSAALRRPTILLVASAARAEAVLEPARYFTRAATASETSQVVILPALDALPWGALPPHPEILETRAMALWRFVSGQAQVLVAPVGSAMLRYHAPETYANLALTVEQHADLPLEDLTRHLESTGYIRAEMAEMPGQYAFRGGIVDVFPPEAARPVRIELLGDTVESLREFDPDTQRSVNPILRVALPPLLETAHSSPDSDFAADNGEGGHAHKRWGDLSLFELVPRPLVIVDEPAVLEEAAETFAKRIAESADQNSRSELAEAFVFNFADWRAELLCQQRLLLEHLALESPGTAARHMLSQPTQSYHGNVAAFMAESRSRISEGDRVIVSAATLGDLERLADLCHEYEMAYQLAEVEETPTGTRLAEESTAGSVPALVLARTPLDQGVVFPECHLTIYGTGDLFDSHGAGPARPHAKTAKFFGDFAELKAGDYVVHVDHGIGQFEGLRQLATDSATGEFMLLRYADDAKLYVPLARMDLVQSYRAMEGTAPTLDKLGGTGWTARRAKVKKSLKEMADKLIRLYASRKLSGAHAFPPDTPWQKEFEDAFEFEETPDQITAIADLKRDMERPVPMDRLLCGDVGYGKTEIAMRAAFKAVMDGKQVAILAPTTVLVFQHYETLRRRFAAFPVKIEMLSRFRTAREQKKSLIAIESGEADLIVGTHRLLSKDIQFRDLGLLIVDEEQRFGVAHKERLKELRKDVHVLTLSATPIPRTLHMSMMGLRDLSVIETPPKDRLAIQTVVASFEEGLVRRAIEEELERKGQVYFIHNRVESIFEIAALVQKLAPKARVVVGHGQMGERELESVMLKFMHDEADVLVSTTIVENGMDIPRANTIIINRADRLGLSELYQLRGRVGRSNQRAYAYLLVPQDQALTPLARQRLAALKEFSELGAGFRIAALDLELRGAGNLLGGQQHGHINAVGFDLYSKMLERAVAELRGETSAPELRVTINLGVDVRIPPEYIPSENLRLRTYKRIAEMTNEGQREEILKELADRFGPPPTAINNLLDYALLKALAEKMLVASIDRRGAQVTMKFHSETPVKPERIVELLRARRGLRLDPAGVLYMDVERGHHPLAQSVRNLLLELHT